MIFYRDTNANGHSHVHENDIGLELFCRGKLRIFARYPAHATPTIGVQRNAVYASYIDLPVMNSKQ